MWATRRRRWPGYLIMVFLAAAGAELYAADAGVPSNEDLRHVRAIAEPEVSPDGARVLVRVTDATADGGRHHLWLVDAGTNTARQLTFSPAADKFGEHNGRWLGDGSSIVFLAKRTEHVQLFRLPMGGGEAHAYELSVAPLVDDSQEPDALPPRKPSDPPLQHDAVPLDIDQYEAAPDGRTIAIIARDPQTPGEKKQKDEKADALWVDHDKHGERLYLLDVESGKLTAVAVASNVAKIAWARKSDRLIALSEGSNHAGRFGTGDECMARRSCRSFPPLAAQGTSAYDPRGHLVRRRFALFLQSSGQTGRAAGI